MEPETLYARLGEGRIAYQVMGLHQPDLIYCGGTYTNIDLDWEDPDVAHWNRRLASFCRLIRFDRRGSGASDPLSLSALPPWESYLDEILAVMDTVGSERAAIMGAYDAGPTAALFAATRPERCLALILANTSAKLLASKDYAIGLAPELMEQILDQVEQSWGTEALALMHVPSRFADQRFGRWLAKYQRSIASPTAVKAYIRAALLADARPILPAIHMQTLVLQRTDYALCPISHGRFLSDHISGARLVEIPGSDGGLPWENADQQIDAIEEFLTGVRRGAEPNRVLATVLFTDIVSSTERLNKLGDERWRELLELHDQTAHRVVQAFRGRLIATTGDGILATFDGPGRGIRAAATLRDELKRLGLEIRSGLHTGEVELRDGDVGGLSVHIGARVMAAASEGEVLVSRTVRDLIAGSAIRLQDRGTHALKGVEGDWQLFAVTNP